MYIQINEAVPLVNRGTDISSCVAKIKRQGTSSMDNGNTEQWVLIQYFESFAFGDACSWDESKQLNVDTGSGVTVKKSYNFERTSADLDAGITTQSLYDDVKAAMVADGFTEGNLTVTV